MQTIKSFGLQGLHLQAIEHEASRTSKLSLAFEPFKRFCTEERRINHASLESYALIFEWAYGYKNPVQGSKINKRRTPSAGALYPIELFLLCNIRDEWKLCYYSFEEHTFFECPFRNYRQYNIEELCPGTGYVFAVSAFWRNVQRYGVRGFRYCLLDSGFIYKNIERLYNDHTAGKKLRLCIGNHALHDLLPLKKSEKVLYSLSLSNSCFIGKQPLLVKPDHLCNYIHSEHAPCISTNMIRVEDAFSKALQLQKETFECPSFNLHGLKGDVLFNCLENRYSVKEFQDEPLNEEHLTQLKLDFLKCADYIKQCYGVSVYAACIIKHTNMRQEEVEILCNTNIRRNKYSSQEIAKQLCSACQNQSIMLNASFSFILFVIPEELNNWSHFKYAVSILCASFICSDFYLGALKYGIGTTTIGGFSERLLMELMQMNNVLPIVVQAFGKAKDIRTKVDAAIYVKR